MTRLSRALIILIVTHFTTGLSTVFLGQIVLVNAVRRVEVKGDVQTSSGFRRTCSVKLHSGSHSKVRPMELRYNVTGSTTCGPLISHWSISVLSQLTSVRNGFFGWEMNSLGRLFHVSTDRVSDGQRSALHLDN